MCEAKRFGKVVWFDLTKGYGFIIPNDGSEVLFVHQTSIHSNGFRSVAEGEAVEYTVEYENGRRTKAQDVMGPDGAFVQGYSGGSSGGQGSGRGGDGGGYDGGNGGYSGGGYGGGDGSQGGGRGGGRGGGGGNGGSYYKCEGSGHFARDCTNGSRVVAAVVLAGAVVISVVTLVILPEISLTAKVRIIGSPPYLCSCYPSMFL